MTITPKLPAPALRTTVSGKRAGQSFEDLIELAIASCADICLARAHPETKMIPDGRGGRRLIYVKKNGVDFVGTVAGLPVALEAKRLPGAASLAGSKNDSTRAEAAFLLRFAAAKGAAAFLVLDPDVGRFYVVDARLCTSLVIGGRVPLRSRAGDAFVTCFESDGRDDARQIVRILRQLRPTGTV